MTLLVSSALAIDSNDLGFYNITLSWIDRNVTDSPENLVHIPPGANISDYITMYANTSTILKDLSTNIVYTDLLIVPPANLTDGQALNARSVKSYNYDGWQQSWKQVQTLRSGQWWSPWYPASHCFWNGKNAGGSVSVPIEMGYQYTWSMDWSAGLSSNVLSATVALGQP
nr:CBM_HP1_G0032160.mRNA.1.CDS.1 [Saccharomyces cerevisiae]